MPFENKKFSGVSGKLLEIHRNELCEEVSSRDTRKERETNGTPSHSYVMLPAIRHK